MVAILSPEAMVWVMVLVAVGEVSRRFQRDQLFGTGLRVSQGSS